MSTGMGDPFDDMFDQLEKDFRSIDVTEETQFNVANKTREQLLEMLMDVNAELRAIKEVTRARTERGRALHSQHAAIVIALNNCGDKDGTVDRPGTD